MNKNQRALNSLVKNDYEYYDEETNSYLYDKDLRNLDIKTLQELVDKATPKKPIHKFVNVCFNLVDYTYCPNCVFSEVREHEHHCHCGQALDWSE